MEPGRRRAIPHARRPAAAVALLAVLLLLPACTGGGTSSGSTGTVSLTAGPPPTSASASATPTPTTTVPTPTPVTPDGLLTGPGISDTTISLGLLVDPDRDRGFSDGLLLWARTVNATGGICGRKIEWRTSPSIGQLAQYDDLARSVAGMVALPVGTARTALAASAESDGMTVLTGSGTSAELGTGLVPLGATDDIKAINALSYLQGTGVIESGSTVGVLSDGTPGALNALAGARWWADRQGLVLDVRTGAATGDWDGARAVLALTSPTEVASLLAATAADVTVITDLDGYEPTLWTAADGDRLLVDLITPAFGSDHPAAAAVARAYSESSRLPPGPRLLAGYAVGNGWARLLGQACTSLDLTRTGIAGAAVTVGPASVDSLFGPSDPAEVVQDGLPATRVSSMAVADPSAPAGLRPLVWLQAAEGITDYVPGAAN
ncbi:ABC transporter substrate-binding protein [Nakamurella sp. YIM 132087]|uniref:ABC transporter substrate-binding protein n=1 Tax=Nakamurella alba TaxID=2665158 RepID=A0A7K1FT01_9ACTN|nr:ABC transporter substrate-binding protein [Nakamurella alba]MTD17282.1 ABC transporter substrate-binding protein [Nakamurella alba]